MRLFFAVCYPLLVHLSVYLNQAALSVLAMVSLAIAVFYPALIARKIGAWLGLFVFAMACFGALIWQNTLFIIYAPPMVIPMIFGTVFTVSLLPGNTALVTDIGERSRGPLSESMRKYTYAVTWLWSILFVVLVAEAALLALFASTELWSLMTNIVNYIIIGFIFVSEYLVRRLRYPAHNHPGFIDYIKIVVAHSPRAKRAS